MESRNHQNDQFNPNNDLNRRSPETGTKRSRFPSSDRTDSRLVYNSWGVKYRGHWFAISGPEKEILDRTPLEKQHEVLRDLFGGDGTPEEIKGRRTDDFISPPIASSYVQYLTVGALDSIAQINPQLVEQIAKRAVQGDSPSGPAHPEQPLGHHLETAPLERQHSHDSFTEAESAATLIMQKGWQITELLRQPNDKDQKFELKPSSQTPERLTINLINDFYRQKLETRLREATRKGLEQLLQDESIPQPEKTLLREAQQALGNPQAEKNIFYWHQLKEMDCWCLQDSNTEKAYVGYKRNNNGHNIEIGVIQTLTDKNNVENSFSRNFQANFTKGLEDRKTIKKVQEILVSIDYNFFV